jgi:hypothetical protein
MDPLTLFKLDPEDNEAPVYPTYPALGVVPLTLPTCTREPLGDSPGLDS